MWLAVWLIKFWIVRAEGSNVVKSITSSKVRFNAPVTMSSENEVSWGMLVSGMTSWTPRETVGMFKLELISE